MYSRHRRNRARASQTCSSLCASGNLSEQLENRTLLSNLAITDAWLVDGTGTRITSPVLGEQLEVHAAYSTDSLSASAAYAIRVIVNGVAVDRPAVTFGAGIGSATWQVGVFHGYAEAGSNTVQVVLDPLGQLAEDNEADNTLTFLMTPVSASNLPQRFGNFVAGTAGTDWRIVNFSDLDPRPGMLRDYLGGQFTYDLASGGHDAIDLGTGNFAATDRGVGILAAATGVVLSIHDGEFDRNTGFVNPAPLVNYVVLDHGNGWTTKYLHLRRDSVSVRVGDIVTAGNLLGWMGSSGFSTGPHVHFEVEYKNHAVETMLDPATYWVTPPAYPADYRHAMSSGLSSQAPTASEWNERPQDMRVFTRGSRVYFWVIAGAMLPGDTRTIRYLRPDGTTYFEQDYDQGTAFFSASRWSYFVTLPANAPLGTWTTLWLQNGVELARESFTVATTGAPAIRVEQATQYIQSERFTPIDFGTVAANAIAPTQAFTITNQGAAPLTLGAIALPAGFELATSPAATVAPGQSTTLEVRLLTATPGSYSGELRMVTNVAGTPVFRIWLEGVVETPGGGTLIPGISIRKAAEGSRFYANVRRTGSTASAVTVTLATDASELQMPSTVIIPAGASFVNFEVQAVQDFSADGDQRIQMLATASGLTQGQNEVLIVNVTVEDDEPLPPRIQGTTAASLGTSFTLTWTPVTDAVDYEVWVSLVSGGAAQIVHTNTSDISYHFPGFDEMGIYRVWVRANVTSGFASRWSLPFDVRVVGLIALQPLPRYVNSDAPTFQWNPVPTAIRYDIWVDDVRHGISQVIRRTDVVTTSFTVPVPLPMSLYRVWVRAIDARGQSSFWSIRNEFFISPRPATAPTPLSTFDRTPTLQWEPVQGARKYEVWVRDDFSGEDTHRVSDIQHAEWTFPTALNDGPYQWWVRAYGDYGVTGLWSFAQELYVGGRPVLFPPVVNPGSLVTFAWSSVQGAITFQLQVDRLDIPQLRVVRQDNLLAATWQTPAALEAGTYRVWVRAVSSSGELSYWSRSVDFFVTEMSGLEPELSETALFAMAEFWSQKERVAETWEYEEESRNDKDDWHNEARLFRNADFLLQKNGSARKPADPAAATALARTVCVEDSGLD